MSIWTARLEAAVEAARQSGEYLLSSPSFSVSHKLSNDYVTDADRHSEEIIRSVLLGKFPDDGFFGEEEGEKEGRGRWIVDPIDGTTNYICDLPLYTISIAYQSGGQLVLGVVYCPRLNEMYTAVTGEGAFLNGQPIHVAKKTVLRDAILGMSFAHRNEEHGKRMLKCIPYMRESLSDMRRLGSAALDLCFTACGRYDGYVELGLYPYDIAAGIVIVREAGGVVTGWPGDEKDVLSTGNTLAASAAIYPAVYNMLAKAQEKEYTNTMSDKVQAIVVLGHRLNEDCSPSEDLKSRIDKTVEYWKETGIEPIMPCGGITRGRSRSEAEVMYEMLIERGVPASAIKLENESRTTTENIVNAVKLLGKGAKVALISSEYHMEGAMAECEHYGLDAYFIPAVTKDPVYREEQHRLCLGFMVMKKYTRKQAQEMGMTEEEMEKYMFAQMRKAFEEGEKAGLSHEQVMQQHMASLLQKAREAGIEVPELG